ncbi:succinate dehydrogenase, hydrophobic membrane anchor protein [Sediminicurvatus halobius]|uniref:Succinate dehydrogenase hydrophobic membrane anchor subunit n=1 Tax=Sediminicurvatus halobius TaxID=2182432 RepID=A0A2U2N3T2_9GAMM|nr:succinate dehydrogenase, hydrophobic membrane anchor protein [Spiribacter halobius]PWG63752.1 succinate dehydrogenase, hydrophobic membrane anchor protein [Spiribacter halobius]UEX76233.1 succinate dehydrogenase, hydrophobic membrane anchor protein [Spiribacter halobius]
MEYRAPIKQARGLGAAHHGTGHWWAQRLTAVALVPLVLWLVIGIASNAGGGYEAAAAWVGNPVNAVLLILFFGAMFYHASLGLQVILEDYVSNEALRLVLIVLEKFAALLLAVTAIFAVLMTAFGG